MVSANWVSRYFRISDTVLSKANSLPCVKSSPGVSMQVRAIRSSVVGIRLGALWRISTQAVLMAAVGAKFAKRYEANVANCSAVLVGEMLDVLSRRRRSDVLPVFLAPTTYVGSLFYSQIQCFLSNVP